MTDLTNISTKDLIERADALKREGYECREEIRFAEDDLLAIDKELGRRCFCALTKRGSDENQED